MENNGKIVEEVESKRSPGAVLHGNFNNYYQFHPAADRFTLLPGDIWLRGEQDVNTSDPYLVLDVGCNTGELTQQLWAHISEHARGRSARLLGVDLDETLIARAKETNQLTDHISYACVDIMDQAAFESVVGHFLSSYARTKFDAICVFSVTMWIHLNHHDSGLQQLLSRLSDLAELLLIEPQPWKCYQTAQRRLRRVGREFPLFLQLQWRSENLELEIDNYLQKQLQRKRVLLTHKTRWQRSLYFYR